MKEELVEAIKAALLPELTQMREAIVHLTAEIKVIHGRLDEFERRFALIDQRFDDVNRRFEEIAVQMRDIRDEMREVRQYLFTSAMHGRPLVVKEQS